MNWAKIDERVTKLSGEVSGERLLEDVLGIKEDIKEVSWSEIHITRHVEALSRLVALSEAENTINFLRNAELLSYKEEVEWLDTPLEGLEADLILRFFTFSMDKVTILLLLSRRVRIIEIAGSVWVVAVSETIFAVATFNQHPVTTSIVHQLHLHVALTNED